jgi:two-component system chemotaxis sensor kinase CheA
MNPLLEQFLAEAREFLQRIGEDLLQLEQAPQDSELLVSLFRSVHTLKGNSGLFEFPEMTRVLHAGEDLMDAVRDGRVAFSQGLADQLLDAMDFVALLCDEIETGGRIDASRAADSANLAAALRALISQPMLSLMPALAPMRDAALLDASASVAAAFPLALIPEATRLAAYQRAQDGDTLFSVVYQPLTECFFQGDDPLFSARQTPDLLWARVLAREAWPALAELDAYRCVLDFQVLSAASRAVLDEHYRYVPDQIRIAAVDPLSLVIPQGDPNGGPVYEDFVSEALQHLEAGQLAALRQGAVTMLHLSSPDLWVSSALRWLLLLLDSEPHNRLALHRLIASLRSLEAPDWTLAAVASTAAAVPAPPTLPAAAAVVAGPVAAAVVAAVALTAETSAAAAPALASAQTDAMRMIFGAQRQILQLKDQPAWLAGRLRAAAQVFVNCSKSSGDADAQPQIEAALAQALEQASSAPLLGWLAAYEARAQAAAAAAAAAEQAAAVAAAMATAITALAPPPLPALPTPETSSRIEDEPNVAADDTPKFGRRADDAVVSSVGTKSLRVDQSKIDRLMNLIGEMVVSKNALPYLAQRAEEQFGVRELAREIKAQYAVINRIAEAMQDAIMQVRMLPVSFVFQRFPRLVRDISRKLDKEVELVLEGEDTEADKNTIESLADPLIYIVRNSLDHGLETPAVRRAAGKPAVGRLTIRARQEGDRVLIDIIDDGRGIDPAVIKRKAYEKGLIDEAMLERISDREAINLVFAAGFSTADVVSDLSGRGVGMDVVRTAVEKVNGSILLESEVGKGTRLRITLPLSMAVTQVMIVESDGQTFGVPMDHVVETVRVPRLAIRRIKQSQTIVLRGSIVPLRSLNTLLGLSQPALSNADDEMAVLVARVGGESVGLIVDDFRETAEIIQKPLSGVLAGLSAYSGSALMGDGSVLMVLNVREMA